MIEVLSKSVEQISNQDIQSLIDFQVPEGERIEYKRELPENGNDDWIEKGRIRAKTKDKILKEAVAFANAYGGAVLLGIDESKAKPPVAAKISPVPRCMELAESLKLVFRDRVEPQLIRPEIFAVPTNGDSGVVIIRVGGASRLAPHRVTKTLVCPIRRQDRCEELSMREIQEMTLNVSRGIERLEKRLTARAECFEQEFRFLENPTKAFGVRVTAMPIGDEIWFDRVYSSRKIVDELNEPWRKIFLAQKGKEPGTFEVFPELDPIFWRPMLRAVRADHHHFFVNRRVPNIPVPDYNGYREIHCDGLVEMGFVASGSFPGHYGNFLEPGMPLILLANLIVQAARLREQAGVPSAEYAIEVQILAKGTTITVGLPGPQYGRPLGEFDSGCIMFPRYPLGDSAEAPDLLNLLRRDFYNALGEDIDTAENTWQIEDWPRRKADATVKRSNRNGS